MHLTVGAPSSFTALNSCRPPTKKRRRYRNGEKSWGREVGRNAHLEGFFSFFQSPTRPSTSNLISSLSTRRKSFALALQKSLHHTPRSCFDRGGRNTGSYGALPVLPPSLTPTIIQQDKDKTALKETDPEGNFQRMPSFTIWQQ